MIRRISAIIHRAFRNLRDFGAAGFSPSGCPRGLEPAARISHRATLFAIIGITLAPATHAAAQQGSVELELSSTTLEVGEAVDCRLVCTNTGQPQAPSVTLPDGLELRLTSASPSYGSFTSIVNGRRSQRETYTYPMRLVALRAGTYVLGPIAVEGDGVSYQTDPVTIIVAEGAETGTPKGDRYLFVEMIVKPQSLFVTQSITATLTIGIRKVEIDGRGYELNLLRDVIDGSSEFSVFTNGNAQSSTTSLSDGNGVRHTYQLFKVTKKIRAEEVGKITVGPVFVKANYPTALRRGFFRGYEVARARKETARADAIAVEAKEPPLTNRPNDYAGAIGNYTMLVTCKPNRVEQGQPVTLTVTIRGSPLDGIAGPDLTSQSALVSRFDFAGDELIGDLESGAKVFRRAVFPKQSGAQTVPPISWSFFDPGTETYVTLTSEPIPISVDPPARAETAVKLPEPQGHHANGTTLTAVQGGISPNYVDPAILAVHGPWRLTSIGGAGAFAIPPLFFLVVSFLTGYRRRLRADVGFARGRRAARDAQRRIRRSLHGGDAVEQLDGLAAALTGYLCDRFDLPPGPLTPRDARILLDSKGLDEATSGQVSGFLETCDALRYAPNAMDSQSPGRVAPEVRNWIRRIEKHSR